MSNTLAECMSNLDRAGSLLDKLRSADLSVGARLLVCDLLADEFDAVHDVLLLAAIERFSDAAAPCEVWSADLAETEALDAYRAGRRREAQR